MKLWVVEGFRCDYTCGLGVALAEDKGQAIDLIQVLAPWHDWTAEELANLKSYDLDKPLAFSCPGGG